MSVPVPSTPTNPADERDALIAFLARRRDAWQECADRNRGLGWPEHVDVVAFPSQFSNDLSKALEMVSRPSVSDQTPATPDDAAARHMAEVTRHPRFAELYAQAAHNVHARDNHDQGDERAEAAVPAVHAEWDPDGDFRSADCLAKGCPLCASSDWAKRQMPSSVQDNTERCGHRSVWKGCARIKGHDGGGHSTYPLTEEDKRAAQARKTTNPAPSSVQGDTTPDDLAEQFPELANARVRVRFWVCPVHRELTDDRGRRIATVEWRGGIAHCTTGDCQITSATPAPSEGDTTPKEA